MKKLLVLIFTVCISVNSNAQKWELAYNLPDSCIPFTLECVDNLVLVPTTYGIYRSDDKGASWGKVSDTVVYDISCYDENTCYTCGASGVIYKTTDGGLTWATTATKPHPSKKFVDVKAVSTTKVLVDAVSGVIGYGLEPHDTLYQHDSIYMTNDGGNTWVKTNVPEPGYYPDGNKTRYIYNDSLIFTKQNGQTNLMLTYDLGQNMRPTSIKYDSYYRIVQAKMVSLNTGFIMYITKSGQSDPAINIYKTIDSGRKFTYLFTSKGTLQDNTYGASTGVSCFDFVDVNTGWLVGKFTNKADIYKTTNGGTQWVRDTLGFENTGADGKNIKLFMRTMDYGWAIDKSTQKIIRYGSGLSIGINNPVQPVYAIYPNPSSNGIYTVEGLTDGSIIKVKDMLGRQVGEAIDNQINLSQSQAGIYFAEITENNGQIQIIKLVRQ
ncbi:MAG: T9SS type A sorting domain-containing protein [Bacteroidota bacterium]